MAIRLVLMFIDQLRKSFLDNARYAGLSRLSGCHVEEREARFRV